jgi:hypothetical protein
MPIFGGIKANARQELLWSTVLAEVSRKLKAATTWNYWPVPGQPNAAALVRPRRAVTIKVI